MSTELQTQEQQQVAVKDEFVSFIERAACDPTFDVEKLERLLSMKERNDALNRKAAFDERLATAQANMPRVEQNGLIDYGAGKAKIPYAKLEDIDAVVRPIYSQAGFSVTWDAPMAPDGKIRVVGKFSCCGHSEQREMTLPADTGGGKNSVQAVASSIAYAKRQISKMFWNIIEKGKDLDGAKPKDLETITQDQADSLRSALEEVGANMDRFRQHFRVKAIEELRMGQLNEAYRMVEAKRKQP